MQAMPGAAGWGRGCKRGLHCSLATLPALCPGPSWAAHLTLPSAWWTMAHPGGSSITCTCTYSLTQPYTHSPT
ncbi:hypothetical protein V8C86DRAFT_2657050 [Haematococcus lacustris]